jgi:hypothetical protein
VGGVAFTCGWWLTASAGWAFAAAVLAVGALWLGRRWLNRRWPPATDGTPPEAAARQLAARCRIICALTVAAAAAMMIVALVVGY